MTGRCGTCGALDGCSHWVLEMDGRTVHGVSTPTGRLDLTTDTRPDPAYLELFLDPGVPVHRVPGVLP